MNLSYAIDQELFDLKFQPAMEVSTEELLSVIGGRKELFNRFYPQVVEGMQHGGTQKFLRAVAEYRDRNIDVLSNKYLTTYTIFSTNDAKVIWDCTKIKESDVEAEIRRLKKEIKEGCMQKGYKPPASLFVNLTPFRLILLLIMRFFLERGQKQALHESCSYFGYSMFYTLFINSFRHGIRAETMAYTMANMSNKHKLKSLENVDELLNYGIAICVSTYRQRIMDATDNDIIYVIGQFKSRLRGYIVGIAQKYYPNDEKKEAIFTSSEKVETDEGTDFIERSSHSGNVEQLAQQYTTRFFQRPVDDQIINICAKMNEVSKMELKNAVSALQKDKARIPEVKAFYSGIFYLYLDNENGATSADIHMNAKKFLAAMDRIYKKGNSKEKNITEVKALLDRWLTAVSPTYREVTRVATINNFRKALYMYFIFSVTLRK